MKRSNTKSNVTSLPSGLVERINREHEAAIAAAGTEVGHALACGKLLLEAKGTMKHGEWVTWLEKNTKVSVRQSQRYMALAKNDNQSHSLIDGIKLLEPPQPEVPELEKLQAKLAQLDSRRQALIQRINELSERSVSDQSSPK